MGTGPSPDTTHAIRNDLAAELSRRELVVRAGALGLGAAIASAVPVAARLAVPEPAHAQLALADGTMQAFFDTIIPGRRVLRTESGRPIHPRAIAGVDREPGAVEADALRLAENPRLGFTTLEPPFLADLSARSLAQGGTFLELDYARRQRVCLNGLAFSNPDRVLWESAAAIAFTAFCAAASVPNATKRTAVGYRVMGHPGTAPNGYRRFSFRRRLNRGRTKKGNLR